MKPRTVLLLALSALALPSVPAAAQDKPVEPGLPPSPRTDTEPKKPGGRIRMGELPPEEKPSEPAKPETAPAEKPERPEHEVWIEQLAKWPAPEAKQASIRLAAVPKKAFEPLVAKLAAPGNDWKSVCGAAATLGKIGDLRAIEPLLAVLRDRKMYAHPAETLDAIVRIDAAGAKPRLVALLLHPAPMVVEEAAARLEKRVGPSDLDSLRDVNDAGGPAARAAAMGLLAHADRVAARPTFLAGLRDAAPDVAFAAARALAGDDAPEAEEALRRATGSSIDRQVAYASVALALRAERTGRRTVDDTLVRQLLGGRGFSGIDPLGRAAAAVVLADVGYFHEIAVLDDVLDQKIVPALIEIVAGEVFWPDLKVFQTLGARRLQRLTGRSAATTPREWAAWWQQSGHTFRARRVLLEIPPESVPGFSFSIRGPKSPGGEAATFAASPEGLAWASPGEFAVLLDETAAADFARAVGESGLLRSADAAAGASEGIAPVEIVVRAGRRERRLPFTAEDAKPGLRELLAHVGKVRTQFRWQRYRAQSQALDLPSFVQSAGKRFAADRTDAERDAALAELITAAIDDARGELWNVRALEDLRSIPDLGAALGDEGTRQLLGRLGRRTSMDAVAEGIVLALAHARRSEAHPHVLDFLLTRASPRSPELMAEVFRRASWPDLSSGLADERAQVRAAAMSAIQDQAAADALDAAVRKGLGDSDLTVRREAVRALGRLRAEWARADLETMASKPGDLRGAAVEALGRLGGKSALPALMTAFVVGDDPGLRVTAVEALGATREPEAISAIAVAMSMDPSSLVREVASRVLVGLGTERAAAELRTLALDRGQPAGPRRSALGGLVMIVGRDAARDLARLVDDPAAEVADAASLELSKWRDGAAVPRLLRMLGEDRSARSARAALELISLESFTQDDPRLVADLYSGWWETSRDRGPRGWLVDALVLRGTDDPGLREWEAGRSSQAGVPGLLAGLRSDSWAVRRACDLALRDVAQRSFGELEQYTSASEAARIASAWEDWWASQSREDTSR